MSDDWHRRESQRQGRFDCGLLGAILAVLFAYVIFFAYVFTEPPALPSRLPHKAVPFGD